nr:FtsQ-type POTRA domain-containing protein [Candidatus Neomarinimicrobiota bacterium]
MKRKKKKKKLNLEPLINATITLTIMFLIYASFWWSSYTRMSHLQQINISGYSIIPEEDHQIQLKPLMGIELEEVNLREVSLLIESHPYVKAARVSRHYPATLSIEIVERQPVAILNVDPVLMIDREGIILPDKGQANDFLVPCLSGFNPAKELYPAGQQTVSVKVQETMNLITRILDYYPVLYSNISEV